MLWVLAVVYIGFVAKTFGINRPVYKVILRQKGFTQFIQYDNEVPPLREFTFCTWIRLYNVDEDHSIFSYTGNDNRRALEIWYAAQEKSIKMNIDEKVTSSFPVDLATYTWKHLCFSYQADYGAWALYLDNTLLSCEASSMLTRVQLPPGGRITIGYSTSNNGRPKGFYGEIFGFNMILYSSIENKQMKSHLINQSLISTATPKTREQNFAYVVFDNLKTENPRKEFQQTESRTKSTTQFPTKTTEFFHHGYVSDSNEIKFKQHNVFSNQENLSKHRIQTNKRNNWGISAKSEKNNLPKKVEENVNKNELPLSFRQTESTYIQPVATQDLPVISEFEVPPKLSSDTVQEFSFESTNNNKKPRTFTSVKNIEHEFEFETPPPPGKDNKVYGQWTSSKFAASVLDYLKRTNFIRIPKKIPRTIPLITLSDSHPYASHTSPVVIRPDYKISQHNFLFKHSIIKRAVTHPEINVKVLKDDPRSKILQEHAKTRPKYVNITVRGEGNGYMQHKLEISESSESEEYNYELITPKNAVKKNWYTNREDQKHTTTLPFLEPLEYVTESNQKNNKNFKNTANIWHNVKTYNNDYTPHKVNTEGDIVMESKIVEANKKHPTLRLKFKYQGKPDTKAEETLIKGRTLALQVANDSKNHLDSFSLLRYNHGLIPSFDQQYIENRSELISGFEKNILNGKNFDRPVKIGNALNEKVLIGSNGEELKKSYVGGVEGVPDIERYRSNLDNVDKNVPPSLTPKKICNKIESYDRNLYVHTDGSIDNTFINSPIKENNLGIQFISDSYKQCSLEHSKFGKKYMFVINWNKTPVRLFGGALPQKTLDLCGFF